MPNKINTYTVEQALEFIRQEDADVEPTSGAADLTGRSVVYTRSDGYQLLVVEIVYPSNLNKAGQTDTFWTAIMPEGHADARFQFRCAGGYLELQETLDMIDDMKMEWGF